MSSPAPSWVGHRLTTKLYLPPARQTLVDRPVLLDQLKEGLQGRLTLVSAPAGFGKTSLVAAWRKQCETPLAWVSLDEEDNEPQRFLDYLIAALQTSLSPSVATVATRRCAGGPWSPALDRVSSVPPRSGIMAVVTRRRG